MKSSVTLASVLLAAAFNLPSASLGQAPAPMTPQEDYAKRLRAAELVSPLTSDLFGDSVSLFNGATEFAVVDIDIPGNGGLPVQLRRRFKVDSRKELSFLGGFGIWDIDVPYLYGVFDLTFKWNQGGNGAANRCSQLWYPQVNSPLNLREIWSGTQMHIPGEGDRELLHLQTTTHPVPASNGPHPWTTRDGFRLRCKSTTANGYPGEGFIAVAPNGTKYTFDVGIERQQNSILKGPVSYGRVKVFLMASRMEDRHGNWVNYNYTAGRLMSITSSDQRTITLTYTGDRITRADANLRSWIYQYGSGPGFPNGDRLDQVVRPDLSTWAYQYSSLPWHEYPGWDGTSSALCEEGPPAAGANFTLTATHPSGAVGAFNFAYQRQGRSGIPRHLACVADGQSNWSLYIANYYDGYTLTGKTINGPGLTPATWSYSYGDVNYALITTTAVPCTTCQQTKVGVVTQPDGSRLEHEFGVLWSHNEGRLVRTSTVAPNNTVLRTETTQYVTAAQIPCAPFPDVVGINSGSDDPTSTRLRPVNGTTITQQDVTFSSTITCFDIFARPLNVTRSSTLGHSRAEVSEYHDNLALWAVGQVKKTTVNGVEASLVEYDTAALPWKVHAFGKLQQTLTYQTDGMLQTVVDGRNNTTTLSSWKRGIAQLIQFADSTSMSAVVNDSGWITSVTDQNGFQTGYAYDLMGRLSTVTFPSSDTTNWNSKTFVFAQIGSSEYGIPAGHWRQTISNGAARKVSYFDALWRPVITHEYDTNNMVGTQRFSGWKYDHDGRVSFAGYPRSSATNISSFAQGTTSEYDALGRPTRVRQDSELGLLDTTTAYLSNFQTQVMNPRGHTTTSSYMAYDEPTTDWPIAITHPEGAYTVIARDAFGKPTSLTRRNNDSSVIGTRSYVYDLNHQLCKAIEPETGSTIMDYDAAGNLSWSASGQNFPSTTVCDTASVAESSKAIRTYDVRNRLLNLNFPDGLGDQVLTYFPDGLPETITAYNSGGWTQSATSFAYNKRRLLESETLAQTNGPSWTLGYAYSANAHPASVTYPSGLIVDYAPNALGQATKAGTYATGVSYFSNGAIEQFTYGNGLVHTLTQNVRGLPYRSLDTFGSAAVLDDSYDFDGNGNVASITDGLPGARGTRTLVYDGLDRLTSAASVMFNPTTGGPATFDYDVLDNLKRVKVGSRDHTYVYDTKQRLERVTNTTGGATVTTLAYDVQGNLANKNGTSYQFDFGNRLREVVGVESYGYDGQGRRVRATHPTQGTIYSLYGLDGVLRRQQDERVGKSVEYVYLGSSLVARISTPIALSTPTLTASPGYSPNGSYSLSWTSSTAATRYELQESVNSGTWTLIQDTSATSRSISGKASGSYRYRARACHPALCGNWSAEATVVVELPPASPPSLTVPSTGLNGSYTVSWGTVAGATSFALEESFNSGAWTTAYTGSAQSRAFTSKAAGSYRYRIQACNGAGCSSVSAASSPVQVIYPPGAAPTVTVPAASNTGSYTVSWTTVSGANRYQLDEQVNGGAWSQIQDSSTTSRAISGKGNGSYGYRARACNDAGCSASSSAQTVVVTLPPASAPTLTVPSSSNNGSYTVSWTSVSTATSYELQERTNGGSWGTIQNTSSTSRAISGKGNGAYDYQVRACNVGGCSGYSTIQGVTVLLPPGSAPTLTAPSSTTVDNYTVSWTSVATATSYELQERFNSGSWSTIQNSASTSRALSGKPNGAYDYQVRACNSSGCGSYSTIRTVTVSVPQPPASAPSLFAPGLLFEGEPYDVSWTTVSGATTYRLEERFNSGAWLETYNGAGTIKSFPGRGQGLYHYRVRACNGAGCGSYSAIQTTAVQASCPFPPCDPGFRAEDDQ